jgi:hypothetical protein
VRIRCLSRSCLRLIDSGRTSGLGSCHSFSVVAASSSTNAVSFSSARACSRRNIYGKMFCGRIRVARAFLAAALNLCSAQNSRYGVGLTENRKHLVDLIDVCRLYDVFVLHGPPDSTQRLTSIRNSGLSFKSLINGLPCRAPSMSS